MNHDVAEAQAFPSCIRCVGRRFWMRYGSAIKRAARHSKEYQMPACLPTYLSSDSMISGSAFDLCRNSPYANAQFDLFWRW